MKPIFFITAIVLIFFTCNQSLLSFDNDTIELDNETLSSEPDNEALLKQAIDYYQHDQNTQALEMLNDIIEENDNDYRARILRGNVYSRMQENELAEQEYKKCIRIDPANTQSYVNLGMLYTDTGRPYKALEYLKEADTIRPYDAVILYLIGNVYFLLEEYDRSFTYFQQVYELNPSFSQNLMRIAEYCHLKGDFATEIKIYLQILKQKQSSLIYYKLGLAAYELGDTQREIESYLKALELEPDNNDIRYNLALAYFDSGQVSKAVTELNTLIQNAPSANSYYYLALCHINSGEISKAWAAYESLKKLDSKLADEIYEQLKTQ